MAHPSPRAGHSARPELSRRVSRAEWAGCPGPTPGVTQRSLHGPKVRLWRIEDVLQVRIWRAPTRERARAVGSLRRAVGPPLEDRRLAEDGESDGGPTPTLHHSPIARNVSAGCSTRIRHFEFISLEAQAPRIPLRSRYRRPRRLPLEPRYDPFIEQFQAVVDRLERNETRVRPERNVLAV